MPDVAIYQMLPRCSRCHDTETTHIEVIWEAGSDDSPELRILCDACTLQRTKELEHTTTQGKPN